jgi:hypothetical protein
VHGCWHRVWLLAPRVVAGTACGCWHRVWLLAPCVVAGIVLRCWYSVVVNIVRRCWYSMQLLMQRVIARHLLKISGAYVIHILSEYYILRICEVPRQFMDFGVGFPVLKLQMY